MKKNKKKTKEFKWRLKTARHTAQLTQTELAKKMGLTQARISDYERGKTTPTPETLLKLSEALHVSVDWLLGIDN